MCPIRPCRSCDVVWIGFACTVGHATTIQHRLRGVAHALGGSRRLVVLAVRRLLAARGEIELRCTRVYDGGAVHAFRPNADDLGSPEGPRAA